MVDALIERNVPLVVHGGPELPGHPLVAVDETAAAIAAAEHVKALGHTRIGAIAIPLGLFGERADRVVPPDAFAAHRVTRGRLAGYREAVPGIAVREAVANAREHGERAANALLQAPDPPTAILCMSDELAIGALRAIGDRNVSVVGWDDTPEAERAGLTTIHQSLEDHGRAVRRAGRPRRARRRVPGAVAARGARIDAGGVTREAGAGGVARGTGAGGVARAGAACRCARADAPSADPRRAGRRRD